MLYRYLVEIKHGPKLKNGAYRRNYVPFNALNECNALLQAVTHCKQHQVEVVGFDVVKGYPACHKQRFKHLRQQQGYKEEQKKKRIETYIKTMEPFGSANT